MTTDPVADADAHLERIDAESERREKQAAMYREIITETLTKTMRAVAYPGSLSLPATAEHFVFYRSIGDVVSEEIGYGKPLTALMAVLAGSDCPLVAKLRQTLADSYSDANADDLAEASL